MASRIVCETVPASEDLLWCVRVALLPRHGHLYQAGLEGIASVRTGFLLEHNPRSRVRSDRDRAHGHARARDRAHVDDHDWSGVMYLGQLELPVAHRMEG